MSGKWQALQDLLWERLAPLVGALHARGLDSTRATPGPDEVAFRILARCIKARSGPPQRKEWGGIRKKLIRAFEKCGLGEDGELLAQYAIYAALKVLDPPKWPNWPSLLDKLRGSAKRYHGNETEDYAMEAIQEVLLDWRVEHPAAGYGKPAEAFAHRVLGRVVAGHLGRRVWKGGPSAEASRVGKALKQRLSPLRCRSLEEVGEAIEEVLVRSKLLPPDDAGSLAWQILGVLADPQREQLRGIDPESSRLWRHVAHAVDRVVLPPGQRKVQSLDRPGPDGEPGIGESIGDGSNGHTAAAQAAIAELRGRFASGVEAWIRARQVPLRRRAIFLLREVAGFRAARIAQLGGKHWTTLKTEAYGCLYCFLRSNKYISRGAFTTLAYRGGKLPDYIRKCTRCGKSGQWRL